MLAQIDLLLSSSGNATPSANSGSLTLDFRERTLAPCIFQGSRSFCFFVFTKPLTHHHNLQSPQKTGADPHRFPPFYGNRSYFHN